jgi:hypothetical protein
VNDEMNGGSRAGEANEDKGAGEEWERRKVG